MGKKVIILCHEPLTVRIKANFYIDDLINAGLNVEYWDISQYIYPGIALFGQINEPYVVPLNTLDEIKKRLTKEDISHAVFVVEVIDVWRNRHLFQLLSDMNCFTIRIDMYGNTLLFVPLHIKLFRLDVKRLYDMAANRCKSLLYSAFISRKQVKGYDLIFSSSALTPNRIPINHPDYEAYVASREMARKEKHIVFLDVFFPLHPDLCYMVPTKDIVASASAYRASLNAFFTKIEKQYNLPVVIAAHPKADYTGMEFQNRKIYREETPGLVRDAALVLLHSSNSVSFAILNDTPFELITNEVYNNVPYLRNVQKKLAWVLGKRIHHIDASDSTFQCAKMDPQRRTNYILNYLTAPESEDRKNKDIILSYFLRDEIG